MIRTLATALLLFTAVAHAQPQKAEKSAYYQGKSWGWFFYEPTPPPPVEEEPVEPPLAPPPPPEEQAKAPEPKAAPAGPAPLSSAWLKANLEVYLFKAIDDPSEENIRAYLSLHRLMLDRSQTFSDNASLVLATNPDLRNDTRRSGLDSANTIQSRSADDGATQALKAVAKKARLVFLFSEKCDLCSSYLPVLAAVGRSSSIRVAYFSREGRWPSGASSSEPLLSNPAIPKALGVVSYPRLYLVPDSGSPIDLGAAVMSASDLRVNLVRASYARGLLTEEQYAATRPIENLLVNIPAGSQIPEELLSDPAALSDYITSRITRR